MRIDTSKQVGMLNVCVGREKAKPYPAETAASDGIRSRTSRPTRHAATSCKHTRGRKHTYAETTARLLGFSCLQELEQLRCRHRLGKQIALRLVAIERSQHLCLLLGFHPFGDRAQSEGVGERD